MADWWRCPNDPPCPHAGVVHDVYDLDDRTPRCCIEGCDCGRRVTLADLAALVDRVLDEEPDHAE